MSRKIRVLVVDDNEVFRDLVVDQLSEFEIEATSLASGEEALKSLKKTDFDVVLLDIKMGGISGLDTLTSSSTEGSASSGSSQTLLSVTIRVPVAPSSPSHRTCPSRRLRLPSIACAARACSPS